MKLSKIQEKAIKDALRQITIAKQFDNWMEYAAHDCNVDIKEVKADPDEYKWIIKYWEKHRHGDVLCSAGKPTIEALIKKGIFSSPEYSYHRQSGVIDWVHVNDYEELMNEVAGA